MLFLKLLIELFLSVKFNASLVFWFCYHSNLVLVLNWFYKLSNNGLKCLYCGVVATFWSCNCNIAATFISFLLPTSTIAIFESISISLLCTSLMVFILYVLSVIVLFLNRNLSRGCLVCMFSLRFSWSKFLINLRWQIRVRNIFSCK